jgi:PAS domain S-box-containing protein
LERTQVPARWLSPRKISLIYVLVGALWILFSDELILALVHDPEKSTSFQILSGWIFVVATGVMLYVLVNRFGQELRRSRARLRQIIDLVPHMIFARDLGGRFLLANRSTAEMYGTTAKELVGKSEREIHPVPDEAARFLADDSEVIKSRQPKHIPIQYFTDLTGRTHTLQATKIPFTESASNAPAVLGVAVDITEQHRLEKEIQQAREELAHAGRLSVMGEMATGIAHELNQPLTAIANYAQACRRLLEASETTDPDVLESIAEITNEAMRAGEIIHRLRGLLRRQESKQSVCDVNALIRDLSKLADMDVRVHDAWLELDLTDDLPKVLVDEIQIQQALLNLIHNGLEAMAGLAYPDKRISVRSLRSGEDEVEVRVVDRGKGVPEDTEKRLFQPFFTTKESGMGIGLSLSRSLIMSHGGRLWFSRNPDRGMTFHLTLPAVIGEHHDNE